MKLLRKTSLLICGFLFLSSLSAFAESKDRGKIQFKILGEVNSTYKMQSDYTTPLDSRDQFSEDSDVNGKSDAASTYFSERFSGTLDRSGANNRSAQKTRTIGSMTFLALGGENIREDNTKWYNLIGYSQVDFNSNNPDGRIDGTIGNSATIGDIWVRYAPVEAIGITVGKQTVEAATPARATGHLFAGDPDEDFSLYTASALNKKSGWVADIHLSKDFEFGLGQVQGMNVMTQLAVGASNETAETTVGWFKGRFDFVELTVSQQNIAVGDKNDDSGTGVLNTYEHKYKSSLQHITAKFNISHFSPYITLQAGSGEKASLPFTSMATVNAAFKMVGKKQLNVTTESRDFASTFTTVGVLGNLGCFGKLAVDYTTVSAPAWGETDMSPAAVELDSEYHIHWEYPLMKDVTLTLFYNALNVKKDNKLREDIKTIQDNKAFTAATLSGAVPTIKRDLELAETLLKSHRWSSTTSMGISLNVKFGN